MDTSPLLWALLPTLLLPLAYLLGTRKANQALAEHAMLQHQLAQQQAQLQQSREQEAALGKALHQLELAQSKALAERDYAHNHRLELQQQLKQHQQELERLQAELSQQQTQGTAALTELAGVKQHSSEQQQKLRELERLLPEVRAELAAAQQRMAELQTTLDERSTVLAERIATLKQTEARFDEASGKAQQLGIALGECRTEVDALKNERSQTIERLLASEANLEQSRLQLAQVRAEHSAAHASNLAKDQVIADLQQRAAHSASQLQSTSSELTALNQLHAELTTRLTEKEQHFVQQLQLLQDSKTELKREFETLANEILERKGAQFKELNRESVAGILNPIHEELKGFKSKVETIHQQETEQRVKLRTELENLQKLNQQITDQADKLTKALKGEKKVQGNWGELMLENVLDNSGLRLGSDYTREMNFEADDGRFRPDVVVHLPQGKHMVIDAKTSLNAYTRFVNAEDELERQTALKEHAQSVKARIQELAQKDYARLPGLNSPEVVVMFIPIESAYVEALRADESIFQKAIEQKVLVTTPTTLLTSLNIVRQLWRFEEQNKHTAELASRAERFYNKLANFLDSMQNVGKQIDKAKSNYDDALKQLYTGRGNLIMQAAQFKELGVSVSKELPPELVKAARLELNQGMQLGASDAITADAITAGAITMDTITAEATDDVV